MEVIMAEVRAVNNIDRGPRQREEKREEKVVCFICRKMVPLDGTLELDHTSGRFKVRVCLKHLEV